MNGGPPPPPHLLHEDLGVVGDHVAVHHGAEGDVVAGGLDVLVHQLPEALLPQALHQVGHLPQVAAHLAGQDLGVHDGPVVHRPAGDGRAALGDGSLEQTCGTGTGTLSTSPRRTLSSGSVPEERYLLV